MVLPSKVISDQYKSVTVATQDGKVHNGMPIVTDGPNLVLLLSDGTKVDRSPSRRSRSRRPRPSRSCPMDCSNPLSYQEIADLLALFNAQPRVAAPETAAKGK